MPLRVLIVDDEPIARRGVRLLLETEDDLAVVGECSNGDEALAAIRRDAPDVVFLDVQMPNRDGFEVLAALSPEELPVVIFVTAYDQYALRAFDVQALDYLLKPFDDDRFYDALARAREQVRRRKEGAFAQKVRALLSAFEGVHPAEDRPSYLERVAVRAGGRVQFFKVHEVDWIEASGDYMCLHIGNKPHYVREKMGTLEEKLDPRRFVRIHRSTIVNVDRIRELRGHDNGGYMVLLLDGTELKLSRSYQGTVFSMLGEVS